MLAISVAVAVFYTYGDNILSFFKGIWEKVKAMLPSWLGGGSKDSEKDSPAAKTGSPVVATGAAARKDTKVELKMDSKKVGEVMLSFFGKGASAPNHGNGYDHNVGLAPPAQTA
jgi:hypothetical protein